MRIIGGRDYYDSALGYGHDPHITFIRGAYELAEADAEKMGIYPSILFGSLVSPGHKPSFFLRVRENELMVGNTRYTLTFPTVIVCGVRYQGVSVHIGVSTVGTQHLYFWNLDKFNNWVEEKSFEFRGPRSPSQHFRETREIATALADYFTPVPLKPALCETIIDKGWTLLVHHGYNPGRWGHTNTPWKVDQDALKHVEFFRAVPPNTMFQEIEMWIGGVLPGAGKPMAQVPDAVRFEKHGMDKTSFRKPKTKRK